jgi:hypothetical protein
MRKNKVMSGYPHDAEGVAKAAPPENLYKFLRDMDDHVKRVQELNSLLTGIADLLAGTLPAPLFITDGGAKEGRSTMISHCQDIDRNLSLQFNNCFNAAQRISRSIGGKNLEKI